MTDIVADDNLPGCTACSRGTKYKCVTCFIAICNVCSVNVDDGHAGYCEEDKRIGVCEKCCSSSDDVAKSEIDVEVVSQVSFFTKPPPKKQKIIDWFSTKSTKKNDENVSRTPSVTKGVVPCGTKKNPKQHNANSSIGNKQTVSVATVEKWKSELTMYNVSEWLLYDTDSCGKAPTFFLFLFKKGIEN